MSRRDVPEPPVISGKMTMRCQKRSMMMFTTTKEGSNDRSKRSNGEMTQTVNLTNSIRLSWTGGQAQAEINGIKVEYNQLQKVR